MESCICLNGVCDISNWPSQGALPARPEESIQNTLLSEEGEASSDFPRTRPPAIDHSCWMGCRYDLNDVDTGATHFRTDFEFAFGRSSQPAMSLPPGILVPGLAKYPPQ
jgi:hypothetical protein